MTLPRIHTEPNPAFSWRRPFHLNGPWWLEPLATRHAAALAVQYRNPQTAARTGLPELGDDLDARQWIELRNDESPATYAFMHARHGLVGYADLFLSRDEGYLCMWIGEDFRGRGWSKALVAQTCALGRQAGLSVIWSSAYQTNHASLKAMAHAGFRELDLHALPPDELRRFVWLPFTGMSPGQAREGMADFCDRTGTGVRFAPDGPADGDPSAPGCHVTSASRIHHPNHSGVLS